MAGKKGYEATPNMRGRHGDKRGGNEAENLPGGGPGTLAGEARKYLEWLAVRNYTPDTIEGRRDGLKVFLLWTVDRELRDPGAISKTILESYQRHLWRYRKKNGKPLGVSTQRSRLGTLKDYFAWMTKRDTLKANPASEIELPRPEKRLPVEPLTKHQVAAVLGVPDVSDPLGIRNRTMMEVFYSTGIRRAELARLELDNLNSERGTLYVRQGKGMKDRVVPVGDRALGWLERYVEEVRPRLVIGARQRGLFLTGYGEPFNPDALGNLITKLIKKADMGRSGSCHLFRHSCATHMLEGGADIRFIQQLLGHSKLETTAIYTEVSIAQLKAVHAKTHPAETAAKKKTPKRGKGR